MGRTALSSSTAHPGTGAQSSLLGSHPPSTPDWAPWSAQADRTFKSLSAADDSIYRAKRLLGRGDEGGFLRPKL